jgi:polyisoprenyl-teichoic acid--peptidoglycan teichoic acid transferase
MKKTTKTALVIVSCILCLLLIGGVSVKLYINHIIGEIIESGVKEVIVPEYIEPQEEPLLPIGRVNILLLGIDDARADTIMLFSIDTDNQRADIISIPRDTYYHRPGYDTLGQRKINAAYGIRGDFSEKSRSVGQAVSNLLGMPIDHYVRLDFEAAREIVNHLGGVEYNVPVDITNNSRTVTYIPKGLQVLDGQKALTFLRFRGYRMADLDRIKAQQSFVKAVAEKSKTNPNILSIIQQAATYTKTSMSQGEIEDITKRLIKYDMKNVQSHMIPGIPQYIDGVSFYIHNQEQTKELMKNMSQ